jgi:hypothetical protein
MRSNFLGARSISRTLETEGWGVLAGVGADAANARIRRDVDSALGLKPQRVNGVRLGVELRAGLACVELCALYLLEIGLVCLERFETEPLFWPNVDPEAGTQILQNLVTNLANALLGIRALALAGLSAEANLVLRGFVENGDFTVAAAFDKEFYFRYRNAEIDPKKASKYWRQYLSPARCREVLSRHDLQLGMSDELQGFATSWREDTYAFLSRFAHVHPLTHLINAFGHSVAGEGSIRPSLGGTVDYRLKKTVANSAFYSWFVIRQLGSLLANRDHGWYGFANTGDEQRSWIAYLWEFNNRYYLTNWARIKADSLHSAE